jgi:DNA-binding HxlR family transcriptional regulator
MVLRDLFVAPKRYTDLQRGLPGIPSNILTRRLKDMEAAGIVQRRLLPRPSRTVYELTKTGVALEPAVVELGRWGAKLLGAPRSNEVITVEALVIALRSTFQPKAAKGVTASYELRIGENVLHASIVRGKVTVTPGPFPDADLTIETGPALRDLLAGELSPHEAVNEGYVRILGNRAHLDRFVELFRI